MDHSQYLSHDTIHALATPPGGALAIIRISGPRAIEFLANLATDVDVRERSTRQIFRAKLHGSSLEGGAPGPVLDDAMVVLFRAPASHTGEEVVELFLHGGTAVIEQVLEALESLGSRQALPGEFSFRAVRNGKMTVAEAQAVADLIAAKNAGAAALALEKMEGSQARLVTELAEGLRNLSTMGELGIDFADQDVEELSLPVLKKRAKEIQSKLEALAGSFDRGKKIQEGVRVAFVGRPNAGKSSFFNALLGEERSIVSEIAGTTRDVVRETITLRSTRKGKRVGSVTLRIEDTAGIRDSTGDQIEREGIARSVSAAKDADIIVFISDAGATEKDWEETQAVWTAIGSPAERAIAILTKVDLVDDRTGMRDRSRLEAFGVRSVYAVSSPEGRGVHEAAEGIVQFCERLIRRESGEVLLTRMDHLRAVKMAISHLERSLEAPGEDLFAADLRQALVALGPVIGETLPEDILGRIFSEFCIGK